MNRLTEWAGLKIVILGNSGSGKSTLARQLAAMLGGRSPQPMQPDPMQPAPSIKPLAPEWVQPAAAGGLATLDLDTIVWEPRQIAVRRSQPEIVADLVRFCASHDRWIVEGCYGDLVQVLLERDRPVLVFLNPGEAVCLQHCRDRPWEPHKYASKAEQDRYLGALLAWVSAYYGQGQGDAAGADREEALSLAGHRRCFDAYDGLKREFVELTDAAAAIFAMVGVGGDGDLDGGDRPDAGPSGHGVGGWARGASGGGAA